MEWDRMIGRGRGCSDGRVLYICHSIEHYMTARATGGKMGRVRFWTVDDILNTLGGAALVGTAGYTPSLGGDLTNSLDEGVFLYLRSVGKNMI